MAPPPIYTSNRAGVVAGIALLATLVIPSDFDAQDGLLWAWFARDAFFPGPPAEWKLMMGFWLVGLLALVAALVSSGRPLSYCYVGLSPFAIAVLWFFTKPYWFDESASLVFRPTVVIVAILVPIGIRTRVGPTLAVRAMQVTTGAAMAIGAGALYLWLCLNVAIDLDRGPFVAGVWNVCLFYAILAAFFVAAGILDIVDGLKLRSNDLSLTRLAREFLLMGVVCLCGVMTAIPLVLMAADRGSRPAEMHGLLRWIHVTLVCFGTATLVVEAATSLSAQLRRSAIRRGVQREGAAEERRADGSPHAS